MIHVTKLHWGGSKKENESEVGLPKITRGRTVERGKKPGEQAAWTMASAAARDREK
jgi:hypothetical protein